MTFDFINFFKYYDEHNINHVAAVNILEKQIPNLVVSTAHWVSAYRSDKNLNSPVILRDFFQYFNEKNSNHVRSISMLQSKIPAELLSDTAAWVVKYREKPPAPKEINLNVPYYNQVDNYRDAHRTCNSSSCAMCLEFIKPGTLHGSKGDDAYVQKVFAIGDSTDHSVQTRVLASYGVVSQFYYNLGFGDIDKSLSAGKPVVIGILHRGSLSAPTGGHMVVVKGKTTKGDYYINDPYGSLNDAYTGPVGNGKNVVYTKEVLQHRWLDNGKNKTGWGRIFS